MPRGPDQSPISRRAFLRGTAGALGAATFGGCAPGGRTEGGGKDGGGSGLPGRPTIRVQGGDFGFPSPFAYIGAPGYWRMSYLFDTLLWPDSTGEQLPWLASSYERSGDGLVHRLTLRDAAWHDGRPMSARDVVFTFNYFASQHLSPLAIAAPRSIAKVLETGERTVEFHLDRPDVNFTQAVLGSVPIIPEHVWSTISDAQAASGDEALIGTGPYRLESRSEAQGRALYVANDNFFLGTPFVRRIEMTPIEDELTAVLAGQFDGGQAPVEGVRNDVLDPFRQDPAFGVISNEAAFAFPLYWNLRRGGALADVRFRQASLMAIDREDLVRRLLTGNGTVGNPGFLPPGNPYYVEVPSYSYDPVAANRLLDEAGYRRSSDGLRQAPDGTPLRFTMFVHDGVPPALPELVAANLRDVGVEVERQVVDIVRLFGIKSGGTYDMLIHIYPGPMGTTPNGDPEVLRPVYHSQPPNQLYAATGYSNPEVDRLLDRQAVTLDEAQRREMVGEIQRIVARDLPVAILYYTTLFFVFRKPVFDQWYYTRGGFGPGVPDVYNKHAFVTGRRNGLEIRPAAQA